MRVKSFGEMFPHDSQWDLPEWKPLVSELFPANGERNSCCALDPELDTFGCTRSVGHDSYHVTHGGTGKDDGDGVYAVWDESGIYRILLSEEIDDQ